MTHRLRLSPGNPQLGAWSSAVGKAFLTPFGVGNQASSVTALGTRGGVGQAIASRIPQIPFLTACATPDK